MHRNRYLSINIVTGVTISPPFRSECASLGARGAIFGICLYNSNHRPAQRLTGNLACSYTANTSLNTTSHPESIVFQVMAKRSSCNSSSNQRSTLGSQGMNGAVNHKMAAIKFDSSSCNTLGDREYTSDDLVEIWGVFDRVASN